MRNSVARLSKVNNQGFVFAVLFCAFVLSKSALAQNDKLTLEITLSPLLENAQVLGFASLGVDNEGSGPLLLSGTLINNTNEKLENLYIEFIFEAGKIGVISKFTQEIEYPFTLDPGQVVYSTNNDIANEAIPGIEETLRFDGGLTVEGEDFIESLDGSTTLPNDIYTFSITISQITDAFEKQTLATQTVELGGSTDGVVIDEQTIFLKTPGDVIGSGVTITNPFPQFSWEGNAGNTYRVIVVRSNGQDSPESLIESARSTESTNGINAGSLLQFENLDFTVSGTTLQFPSSGVLPLKEGQTYYWQVITEIQTAVGSTELTSEVWAFRLGTPGDDATQNQIDGDTFDVLMRLIGEEEYASLTESGYSFESIEFDNQIITGVTAIQLLAEIIQKIEDGEIILNAN